MILILIYVVKVIVLNIFQKILNVAHCLLQNYEQNFNELYNFRTLSSEISTSLGSRELIHKVYGNKIIVLGYPKFAHGGLEWSPYSLNWMHVIFFLGLLQRQMLCCTTSKYQRTDR